MKEGSVLVGTCGLFAWNPAWKKCTLGYELAPEATGRGLMREALERAISWGFEHMQLNRIEALVDEQNAASLAVLERFGFMFEGRLREVGYWARKHHDLQQYSLLESEWRRETAGAA